MSDERDGGVDVATVRERVEQRDDMDVDDGVLTAIEKRTEGGRLTPDAFAAWRRECRQEHQSVSDEVAASEERLRSILASLDATDRDSNQVQARVDEHEDRFTAMRADLSAAADRLDETPTEPDSPVAFYRGAKRLARGEQALHEVDHGLHHVEQELSAFESWLHDPDARVEEFETELGGFDQYLDNTDALLDRIEAGTGDADQRFDWWLAAYHLQQVMSAVFAELRTDLAELESWLDRQEGDYGDELAALGAQLDSLEERHAQCSARLDETAESIDGFDDSWTAVADTVASFEAAVDDLEPPVDWGEVERLLQTQFDELNIEIR
ncbi:hypothetical protein [Haloplanus halobius]|uniref:hypothetical protein n=1 Tax=Haloplanus halobius TaxID=2934938 RepID=UPI00200C72E8|nr:hypothetical protein [Haloplanus sp. XH21]